ncbi:MAG: sulfotransferase, partial [Pseudomonadota bacterium]
HEEGWVYSAYRYAKLFEMFGKPSMDVSPNYSRFANLKAAALAEAAPEAKILMLVRDPAARLWSAARMQARRQGREEVVQSLEGLQAYAAIDGVRQRSTQGRALRVWRKAAGRERVGAYAFDRLIEDPVALRQEIARFCGLDPEGFAQAPVEDRKAERSEPVPLPKGAERWMAEHFADEYEALAEDLPPWSQAWAARAEALRAGQDA